MLFCFFLEENCFVMLIEFWLLSMHDFVEMEKVWYL
jgi:hypothetical protein